MEIVMEMKVKGKNVDNPVFKDSKWYLDSVVDICDLKFGSLVKNLGKALNPVVKNAAKEFVDLYVEAFNTLLEKRGISDTVSASRGSESYFEGKFFNTEYPSRNRLYFQLKKKYLSICNIDKFDHQFELNLSKDFSNCFRNLCYENGDKYQEARKYVDSCEKIGSTVEAKIVDHINSVVVDVEYSPLPIDNGLTLRKSFVPQHCDVYYIEKEDDAKLVCSGVDTIKFIIDSIEESSSPLVVHGQPGHGKTSTMKMLVCALSKKIQQDKLNDNPTVLFYEFKRLNQLGRSAVNVLKDVTDFVEGKDFFDNKKTILIFDGLDERQITDGNDSGLKDFLHSLFMLADDFNNKGNSSIKIVITGRSQYVSQISSHFGEGYQLVEIKDFDEVRIKTWLDRFNAQKSSCTQISLAVLKDNHLNDLINQPILLAASAILLSDEEGKQLINNLGGKVDRVDIYRTIVKWSFTKAWQKVPTKRGVLEGFLYDDYYKLLQSIALEMFRKGSEVINISYLSEKLDSKNSFFEIPALNNKDSEFLSLLCSELRISFFFKGVKEEVFSFIHKSVKDFLVVEAVINGIIQSLKGKELRRINDCSRDLYYLLGEFSLSTDDHLLFIKSIIEKDKIEFDDPKIKELWVNLSNGDFPIPLGTDVEGTIFKYRYLYFNWYAIISNYFAVNESYNKDFDSVFNMSSVFGDKKSVSFSMFVNSASYYQVDVGVLNFSGQELYGRLRGEVRDFDFSGAVFKDVVLVNTELTNCKFRNSNITGDVIVANSVFNNCDFGGAFLDGLRIPIRYEFGEKVSKYSIVFNECNFLKSRFSKRTNYRLEQYSLGKHQFANFSSVFSKGKVKDFFKMFTLE